MKNKGIGTTKKVILAASFVLMATFFTACGKPEDPVKGYCEAIKAFDFAKSNEYVANQAEDSWDNGTIEKEMPDIWNFAKESAGEMNYTIVSTNVNGDKASVTVKFDHLDASGIMNAALADYVSKATAMSLAGNTSETAMQAVLIDCFNEKRANNTPGKAETTLTFECVNVDGKWKIDKIPDGLTSVVLCNIDKALNSFGE